MKTKSGRIRLGILLILVIVASVYLKSGADDTDTTARQIRAVSVASVSSFSESASTQLIGTVSSIDQAVIQTESAGRVTSVGVTLGQTVSAGQIIARLENASEYAAVLQAEGAYEGALAAAQISDVSVLDAENSLTSANNNAYNAYTSAYSTLRDIYQKDLDLIVADPGNTFRTPGATLRNTAALISKVDQEYRQLGVLVTKKLASETTPDTAPQLLLDAQATANLAMVLINDIQALIDDDDVKTAYDSTELAYLSTLSEAQSKVDSVLLSLKTAEVNITAAKKGLAKSQLGGTSGEVSSANAQVKQALGSLRAAQANYNKTVLRSPITGVVNSIDIKTGDFVSGFQTVAEIANNDALEVTTYVGQSDREIIALQQEVMIEGKIPGTITTIAPAVNPSTGKIEVKIQSASPNLVNGDTVTISLGAQVDTDFSPMIQVPLTSVKFTSNAGSVFIVEDETLVTRAVEIGSVRDAYIEILSGITPDMKIVVDVRGLSEGEKVTVIPN